MKSTFKKQHGTALLVTILLAGAISLVAFGMTKVALNEIFVGTKGEEGLEAFYAAQAGIDDGLMRFKFHDKADLELPADAEKDSKKVIRVYINKNAGEVGKVSVVNPINIPPSLTVDDYVYDLKVWYKESCLPPKGCVYELEKDQSILLGLLDAGSSIQVSWDTTNRIINSEDQKKAGLWYRLFDPVHPSQIDPRGESREFLTIFSSYNNSVNTADDRLEPYTIVNGTTKAVLTRSARSLKLKAFLPSTDNKIKVKILTNEGKVIGGPKTYIESTGYYGDTAKKIVATIDRDSKSIIDVFDYVIYSGQGPLPR